MLTANEKPLLRAGLTTDTHVTPNPKSVDRLRAALKLFKQHNVDVVLNLGDVADKHHPEAYRHYRNAVKEVYPQGIKEIFAYANHDVNPGMPGLPRPIPYSMVKKALEITHEPVDEIVLNGVVFVTFPETMDSFATYEKHLTAVAKKHPGKPLFVLSHRPPYNTTFNSLVWARPGKEKVFEKFPQMIHLCGHVHNDVHNELCIWQGAYTAVDTGCISGWSGELEGTIPSGKSASAVLIMEVYKDKVLFHRLNCLTGKVIAEPWCVPLPHDPVNPPYLFENRKKNSVAPEFPEKARIRAIYDPEKFEQVNLRFSTASPQKDVFKYEIFIKDKISGNIINRQEIFGDFYRDEPVKNSGHIISAGYFEDGKEYILEVVPFNFFGRRGKPLQSTFKAPAKLKWKKVFECKDPMKTLKFKTGLADGEELEVKNGFYLHNVEEARLIFPDNVWEGKRGTRFRFTIDMYTRQGDLEKWTLVLRNPVPMVNAKPRLYTQNGDIGVRRYVIEFTKAAAAYNYYFLVREGDIGEIRFDYVKIEKLD